jgi:cell division septum initiation protein DivIVA
MSQDQMQKVLSDNEKLLQENQELKAGMAELKAMFNEFTSQASADQPAKTEQPKIPTEPVTVKVGKETRKVKFLVPKFRLADGIEVTAMEASTDAGIMQKLVESESGVIQIIE